MSVMIRHDRRKNSTNPAPSAVEPTRQPRKPEPEAPDRGDRSREAPDAGEGRAGYVEHEFTHGRSQS